MKVTAKIASRLNPACFLLVAGLIRDGSGPNFSSFLIASDIKDKTKEAIKREEKGPGSYQNLDLFIKVLWVLCPNLTDDEVRPRERMKRR